MSYRLGIDIGGTFTDATLVNEVTGEVRIGKVSSTPADPSVGFLAATSRILKEAGVDPKDVKYVVHGTTVATNAIIEGKTAKTAFVTTDGFRDMLEIARQIRPSLYDLQFEKPRPVVPRNLCFGVPERLDAVGRVLAALDETHVRALANRLQNQQIESIAICLLHSYINAKHEERVAEILGSLLPSVKISVSSHVAPEIREYYRASTTVINASIRPIVERYLASIESRLRKLGLVSELLIMQSSGGVFTFEAAGEKPVFIVESGPAAGVLAASHLGRTLKHKNVLSFDMGGTTAKVGLIEDGVPKITKDYEVGAEAKSGTGGDRGSGYPIRTPVIDLVEIGAGGGSIAWVDSGGALRIGPRSAGADPGPVCYGKGGTEPTVTDANLVLGRLNPDYFLGGEIKLDVELARKAIHERCAKPLGMSVLEAANGIVEIANAAMVNAMRLITIQRGYDPREFVLVGFGGGGPAHANRLAEEMDIPVVIIPVNPGTASSMGLLVTDLKHDYTTTVVQRLDRLDKVAIKLAFEEMRDRGLSVLKREGVADSAIAFEHYVEMRYVGQSFELTIDVPEGAFTDEAAEELLEKFHSAHEKSYGYCAVGEPTEIVNLRLTAIGRIEKPAISRPQPADGVPRSKSTRPVYFSNAKDYVQCPIYDRSQLGAGNVVRGPAIVEEFGATTVVLPGYQGAIDPYGNLLLSRK